MTKLLRRFSDWFALFGLVLLFAGMLGTARQFKELTLMSGETPPEGFLPITVEMDISAKRMDLAPSLAETRVASQPPAVQPAAPARPTTTPFQPAQKVEGAALVIPVVSNETRVFLPSISFAGEDLDRGPAPSLAEAYPASPAVQPVTQPTATAPPLLPDPAVPDWLDIPVIGLSTPVISVAPVQVSLDGRLYEQWTAPDQAVAGWHERSARLFENGNMVLNGHHNIYGSVFANLKEVQPGAEITIHAGGQTYRYVVAQIMILEERYASMEQRSDNARWILPSDDRRLTLVTCWPPESNTHRVIVVARPEGNP